MPDHTRDRTPGDSPPAIEALGISKRFQLHHQKATSLKERLLSVRRRDSEDFWALRDVQVTIARGETVGLIGPNGSGKSTLLKVLAGILEPSAGTRTVRGRIASLLELGAGFDGELTGRENIYLNASILGLSRRETDQVLDSILAFSELGPFIDNQVKHYSSGMYVRLGFAIAIHVDPDILLVDEVLAVGDEAFANKCLAKVRELQQQGRTILFVTHSLDLVPELCTRGVVLHRGRVVFDGDPAEAAGRLRALLGTAGQAAADGDSPVRITTARVTDPATRVEQLDYWVGDPLAVEVDLDVDEGAPPVAVRAVVTGPSDYPMYELRSERLHLEPGSRTVRLRTAATPALQGLFSLSVAVLEAGRAGSGTFDDEVALEARRFGERVRMFGPVDYGMTAVEQAVDLPEGPPPPAARQAGHEDQGEIRVRLAAARGVRLSAAALAAGTPDTGTTEQDGTDGAGRADTGGSEKGATLRDTSDKLDGAGRADASRSEKDTAGGDGTDGAGRADTGGSEKGTAGSDTTDRAGTGGNGRPTPVATPSGGHPGRREGDA